jgi:hypothetical protein
LANVSKVLLAVISFVVVTITTRCGAEVVVTRLEGFVVTIASWQVAVMTRFGVDTETIC